MHKPRYITTTIPYVNAKPHVGFALEVVQADALARLWRLLGHDVFFNAGTDEHGQKIWEGAQKEGKDVQAYVDAHAQSVRELKDILNLSYDNFVRTTDPAHKAAAQEMWRRCDAAGDIYKKTYRGLYCVGCEKYITEKELVNGECSLHPGKEPIELEEENYFFRLSKYQQYLEEYLSKEGVIEPDFRRQDALAFVRSGLDDFSISREKERLPWGVPVPGDDAQVMYVWFDALTNYVSTLGWPSDSAQGKPEENMFEKFWVNGETLQTAGKDQVRFQSIMWQAMLRSANMPATKRVFYHGFINSGGQRMSKSLGNVISPKDLVEKYSTDATRYFLLRHVHPFEDTDITWERLDEWYEAHLVNGLGNLVARVMRLAEVHLEKPVNCPEAVGFPEEYTGALERFEFNVAADFAWKKIQELDERITRDEPFKMVKVDVEKGRKIIQELALELYLIARILHPFMPETSAAIASAVQENKKPENLFPRLA
jgi:methionyl-tRNA synthetase